LLILIFSVYVPALTLMVEPAPAASIAAWIVVKAQPLGQTSRVAADADVAVTTLLMVRVEAIREIASKFRTSFNRNLPIGLTKG
jgi:hypothetical protein